MHREVSDPGSRGKTVEGEDRQWLFLGALCCHLVNFDRVYSTCCAHSRGTPRVREYLDNRLWRRRDIMTFDPSIWEGDARLGGGPTGDSVVVV